MKTPSTRTRQSGTALFIALIAVVALSIAGLAMMRSVDISNLIAGNLAFRQAALQVSDIGIEMAFKELETIATEANSPSSCTTCKYYSSERCANSRGMPTVNATPAYPGTCPGTLTQLDWSSLAATEIGGYSVRYVIERLCDTTGIITDVALHCRGDVEMGGGSKKIGGTTFSKTMINYQVTVQVTGPRNTITYVQAVVER